MTVNASELSDPYDVTTLLELCMGDTEMAEELLDRFVSRLDTFRVSLETSIGNGDRPAAAAVAHSLKGEAGMLAAHQLHQRASQLEQALRGPDCPELDLLGLLGQLQTELTQCVEATPAARNAVLQMQTLQP